MLYNISILLKINEKGITMNILFFLTNKADVFYLFEDDTVSDGIEKMKDRKYAAVPVIKKSGEYVGTASEGDFLWSVVGSKGEVLNSQNDTRIKDIIRNWWNHPVKVDETMENLVFHMMNQNFVPVVDDRNFFMGIITRKSLLSYLANKSED